MFTGAHGILPPKGKSKHHRLARTGIDYGPEPLLIAQQGNYAIIRQQGHTAWSAVGQTSYFETQYFLVRATESDAPEDYRVLSRSHFERAERILDIEEILVKRTAGRAWRKCLRELSSAMEALAKPGRR